MSSFSPSPGVVPPRTILALLALVLLTGLLEPLAALPALMLTAALCMGRLWRLALIVAAIGLLLAVAHLSIAADDRPHAHPRTARS